jgi:hypothetical protein
MLQHMIAHQLAPDAPQATVADMAWRSGSVMLGFGLSIPVFFATTDAWVLGIIGLLVGQLGHLRHRGRAILETNHSRPPAGLRRTLPARRDGDAGLGDDMATRITDSPALTKLLRPASTSRSHLDVHCQFTAAGVG